MSNTNSESVKSPFIHRMVKAGAGAGKTYGLIHQIVELVRQYSLENEGQFPRFVVTTFTRKATQEVRERLLTKALELRKSDPAFGELFLKFLKGSGFLLVSTIHGVLNVFLRQHGQLIGLDPDFKLTAPSKVLLSQTLHDLLLQEPRFFALVKKFGWRRLKIFFLEHHRASMLNPELQPLPEELFIKHWQSQIHLIITASYDLSLFVEPLAAKSKGEALKKFQTCLLKLNERLRQESNLWAQFQIIKEIRAEFPKSLGALTQWDSSYKELRKNLMELLGDLTEDSWTQKEFFESQIQDQQILSELGIQFSQQWLKKKIALSELELEDLELLSLYILRRFSQETKVFSDSWNYWFIDEYQDTSPIQVEILNSLIGTCPHYVVGDPQQSIYFFRGARSKVFHEKLRSFAAMSAKIEEKKINRRSQTPTLHFINDLMDLVNKHQFIPMDPLNEKATNEILVGHFYLVPEENEEEHLGQLVRAIKRVLAKGVEPSGVAILCRENRELQKVFHRLREAGLPAQIFSQGHFLEDRSVRDALSFWHFLVNPYNDENLIELLRSHWFLLEDDIIFQAAQRKKQSLWRELKNQPLATIERLKKYLEKLSEFGHFIVWQQGLIDSHAFEECTIEDRSGRKEGNLWKLVTLIHDGIKQGKLNYADPLNRELNSESNTENEAQAIRESNQIKLMTIHGSKGLEFDHVFLPFLNHTKKRDGAPFFSLDLNHRHWCVSLIDTDVQSTHVSFFGKKNAEEIHALLLEESERLFYVAITRAKNSLHFFCPDQGDLIADSGWAFHLKDFVAKEPGVYLSKSGQYEFEVLKSLEDSSLENNQLKINENKKLEIQKIGSSLASESTRSDLRNSSSNKASTTIEIASGLTPATSVTLPTSITDIINQKINKSVNPRSLLPSEWDMSAMRQGILAHREFESFRATLSLENLSPLMRESINKVNFPLMEIIKNGYTEWAFSVLTDSGSRVEGQIDLWGRDSTGQLWIVDYKTGSPEYKEKAFLQMTFYAWGLQKTAKAKLDEEICLVVYYPFEHQAFIKIITRDEILKTVESSYS